MIHAPVASPAMNVISISENACVLEPSANASSRVHATSYSIATKPDTPMPITANRSSPNENLLSGGCCGAC